MVFIHLFYFYRVIYHLTDYEPATLSFIRGFSADTGIRHCASETLGVHCTWISGKCTLPRRQRE